MKHILFAAGLSLSQLQEMAERTRKVLAPASSSILSYREDSDYFCSLILNHCPNTNDSVSRTIFQTGIRVSVE